jgi:ABC-2 type transport system ATP-binding protein
MPRRTHALLTAALVASLVAAMPAVTGPPSAPSAPSSAPDVEVTAEETDEFGNEMTSLLVSSFDGTQIDVNVCRPAAASAAAPVPVVFQSHGWKQGKANCINRLEYFNAGLGYASMSQRGNHGSGGENNVMDPDLEGRDIMAVIDHLASLDWVAKDDGPGGSDPVLGGLGDSYGGGFQWVGAFTDQWLRDAPTRFNTLVPGNTWYDLRESLAPNGVLRTLIVNGLYGTGMANEDQDIAPWFTAAMAAGNATGLMVDVPPAADWSTELHQHGAAWFVEQGMQLDIPVHFSQGAGDLVFPLNDGINAYEHALTPEARERSVFLNHQGGHGLLGQLPKGPLPYTARSGDTCDAVSTLAWFRHTLLGEELELEGRIRLRTVDGDCHHMDAFPEATTVEVPAFDGTVIANAARGEYVMHPLVTEPATIGGIPHLTFSSTNTVPDARVFWGLAVGTSPEDVRLVGGQWMPSRVELPGADQTVSIELGAVVVDVEEGETLYLVASSSADQFVAHASRAPGVTILDDVVVELPFVG